MSDSHGKRGRCCRNCSTSSSPSAWCSRRTCVPSDRNCSTACVRRPFDGDASCSFASRTEAFSTNEAIAASLRVPQRSDCSLLVCWPGETDGSRLPPHSLTFAFAGFVECLAIGEMLMAFPRPDASYWDGVEQRKPIPNSLAEARIVIHDILPTDKNTFPSFYK